MTQTFHYFSPTTPGNPTWDVDLGSAAVRLGEEQGLVHCFELGTVGAGGIKIDDPDGTVGHTGDAILGLKQFYVTEDACPAGDQRIFTGYLGPRTYSRGPFRTGAGRIIDAALLDENAMLMFRVFQPASLDATSSFDRPAETDTARIAALLAVDFLSTTLYDEGFVVGAGVEMDANDYTGSRPGDVIEDCAQQSGCNFGVRYSEATGHLVLHYHANNADIDPAGASISNVLGDLSATCFAPNLDWELTRDPSRVPTGVLTPYKSGMVYEQRLETSYVYGYRDAYYPSSNIATAAKATARALRYLAEGSTEDDRLSGTITIPAADVNLIKAGQYLTARFSHFPGYEEARTCRVLRREIAQIEQTDQRYTIRLELAPIGIPAAAHARITRPYGGPGIFSPPGPASVDPLLWDYDGDSEKPGDPHDPKYGLVDYYPVGAKPAQGWTGLVVLGYGSLDIEGLWDCEAVTSGTVSFTGEILLNGVVVATDTVSRTSGLSNWNPEVNPSVTGLAVVLGDVITARSSISDAAAFKIPAGAGTQFHRLMVTGMLSDTI